MVLPRIKIRGKRVWSNGIMAKLNVESTEGSLVRAGPSALWRERPGSHDRRGGGGVGEYGEIHP